MSKLTKILGAGVVAGFGFLLIFFAFVEPTTDYILIGIGGIHIILSMFILFNKSEDDIEQIKD